MAKHKKDYTVKAQKELQEEMNSTIAFGLAWARQEEQEWLRFIFDDKGEGSDEKLSSISASQSNRQGMPSNAS